MFLRLLPILLITFIDILGFSVIIALMPFFVIHFGVPISVVGFTLTVYAGCQFIAGPLWGYLSDRIGRKTVFMISQVGGALSWTLLAFAPNLTVVFIARALEGISGGNLSLTHAYVADMIEPDQRGKAFAYTGAAFSAGLVLGPALGGFLYARSGYMAPFLAAAALQVLTLVVTYFILPDSKPEKKEHGEKAHFRDFLESMKNPVLRPLLSQRFVYALALYGWFAVFSLVLAAQLHYGAAATSYLFAGFGVASIVVEVWLVGKLSQRFGDRRSSSAGIAICVLTFLFAPFVHDLPTAIFMISLFAVGLAITDATLPSLLANEVDEAHRGAILGIGSSLENLSGVVMPPITAAALQHSGVPATAMISAVLALGALAIGIFRKLQPTKALEVSS
jgi:DHA1 family tetracycline resistance protein-like MFS transporter